MNPKGILTTTFLFIGILAIISLRYPPNLGSDFQHMQRAWDHWTRSGQFNRLAVLDPQDIARPATEFVTWWSPGAQILIGITEKAGLSIGLSLSMWLGITALVTAWGMVSLYRQLGFGDLYAALAVMLGTLSYWGLYNFRQFQSADPFTNALTPWLFLWLMRIRSRPLAAASVLAVTALLGSLMKLSFFITAASAASALVASALLVRPQGTVRWGHVLRLAASLAGGLGIAWWALHACFLSKGTSPSAGLAYHYSLGSLLHASAMASLLPFSSLFSFVSISNNVCALFSWPHLQDNTPLIIATLVAALLAYGCILKTVPERQYRGWIVGVLMVYATAFSYLFFRQSAIGYDDRYFRAVSFLLMPGVVACGFRGASRSVRFCAITLLALGTFWGVASYSFRIWEVARRGQTSYRGYSLFALPKVVESAVRNLDTANAEKRVLFCSTENEALIAVRKNRAVELPDANSWPILHGRTSCILLVLPPGVDCAAVQSRFADYSPQEWRQRRLDGWAICETISYQASRINHEVIP
jgi:hypothetical protein